MIILLVFITTLLLSAALLFSVQPMFTKMILPLLGGSPAVWNTSMVFYQATLFLGYLYAHYSAKWLGVKRQAILHLIILAIALFALPIAIPQSASNNTVNEPIAWLLVALTINVGLPFFAISSIAPMLQKWFSYTSHHSAKDPYFLYAASNIGSMGALVAYPLIIEPFMTLNEQSSSWMIGYLILVLLIALSALFILMKKNINDKGTLNPDDEISDTNIVHNGLERAEKTTNKLRLWWVILAFVPSSLLLGVTNYISTDIASIPLLWVIPLILYLMTFTIAFARRPIIPGSLVKKIFPFMIVALACLFILSSSFSIWTKFYTHLVVFFVTALLCHGILADKRPRVEELTEFYIWLSIGGILGGAFNALLAPAIFNSIVEYPLMIAAVCLLLPATRKRAKRSRDYLLDLALPVILFLILAFAEPYLAQFISHGTRISVRYLIAAVVICSAYFLMRHPLRLALITGVIIITGTIYGSNDDLKLIYRERSFFGVHTVLRDTSNVITVLKHGSTVHGAQLIQPKMRRESIMYYNPRSPIADLFSKFTTRSGKRRVAIVGLGAGALANYSRHGEDWTYYEIDPAVSDIALNPKLFTFLSDSKGTFDIILGDARLKLKDAPNKSYDIIVLDAFSSDSIPIHLLTKEALTLYASKLSDGGVLAFNMTNNYIDIRPVLAALARSEGLTALTLKTYPSKQEMNKGWSISNWAIMAKDLSDFRFLVARNAGETKNWKHMQASADLKPWTDDFSNIISILK